MSKLTSRPDGNSYQERLCRHRAREDLAKRWLQYLVEGLHILLVSSIMLFMAGLLYQLRNLGKSFEKSAPRLLLIWQLGMALSSPILITVTAATMHALFYEASPFVGPFSKLVIRLAESGQASSALRPLIAGIITKAWLALLRLERQEKLRKACGRLMATDMSARVRQTISDRFYQFTKSTEHSSRTSIPDDILTIFAGQRSLISDFPTRVSIASLRPNNGDLRLYSSLPAEQCIAGVLCSYDWRVSGSPVLGERKDAFNLAQDHCYALLSQGKEAELMRILSSVDGASLARSFLQAHDNMLMNTRWELFHFFFRQRLLSVSNAPDNSDLLSLASLPFEQAIANVLCSHDRATLHGDREEIFSLAEDYCYGLLLSGRVSDLLRIISVVDRVSILRSYFRCRHAGYREIVEFVAGHCDHHDIRKLNEFMMNTHYPTVMPTPVSDFLVGLRPAVSINCDLSHFLRYLSAYRQTKTWMPASTVAVTWLKAYSVSKVSDRPAVRRFLQCCIQTDLRDNWNKLCETSNETRDRARSLLEELDNLSRETGADPDACSDSPQDRALLSIAQASATLDPGHIDDLPGPSRARPLASDCHERTALIVATSESAAIRLPDAPSSSATSDSAFEASSRLENAQTD
ncbi:hypothetical protein SISSUDRAFT_1066356 [Sistotremastrum suecicum HHB10207 ss-3]|uniref:DUF6535 domain-containing protein n=1 Tax=Sistotremastrum suecicum HHB10207 ss-3 TaxID=1314776 RepID=A0A165YEQ8_9AGAM|nr:hypothetical protein SISSUDRAFT_1066356 [Sistotremastrum suecicum HHB10207 ss-3]